ncbi:MAG: 5'-3' exonuclease [Gaiellales bacterium]
MSEARRPLLVIDGDSLAHRVYHALPPIKGAGGRPVNALVGFANLLLLLWDSERPRAALVGWDTYKGPLYRRELWPAYQGTRPDFDPEIVEQLERLPKLVASLGLANAKQAGYEADDFLAAACRQEREAGGSALVVTSDRDAYQLVCDAVTVLVPQTGGRPPARVGTNEVVERYGVLPEQVPDFIALRGDPSDNLPGAPGIGAKTAATLLGRYGTLENLLAHADELSPRQAAALREHDMDAFRRVATMDAQAPVDLPADTRLDTEGGAAFAREIGALRLAQRLEAMPSSGL